PDRPVAERGVAKAKAERQARLGKGVDVASAGYVAARFEGTAGRPLMRARREMAHTPRKGHWQATAGRHLAEDRVSKGRPSLDPGMPGEQHGAGMLEKVADVKWPSGKEDDDERFAERGQLPDAVELADW